MRFKDEYRSILGMMAFAIWASLPLELLTSDEESDYGEDFVRERGYDCPWPRSSFKM
ncbi:MAG: hypothetical protein HY690_16525 [Chloroflexi bacterium]|nr:hypothetical protein [Chloroflexota bacterium]